jgi:hypothetical protein
LDTISITSENTRDIISPETINLLNYAPLSRTSGTLTYYRPIYFENIANTDDTDTGISRYLTIISKTGTISERIL